MHFWPRNEPFGRCFQGFYLEFLEHLFLFNFFKSFFQNSSWVATSISVLELLHCSCKYYGTVYCIILFFDEEKNSKGFYTQDSKGFLTQDSKGFHTQDSKGFHTQDSKRVPYSRFKSDFTLNTQKGFHIQDSKHFYTKIFLTHFMPRIKVFVMF